MAAPAGRPQTRPTLWREGVGEVLRAERHRQQRTLSDVAGAARVSMPYLSEIERGLKEPSSEVIAAICGALGLHLAEVLARVYRHLVMELSATGQATTVRAMSPTGSGRSGASVAVALAA